MESLSLSQTSPSGPK
uniref:Uncharacterized protein n=1 Tax=Arundo donax TaxID=35708 RepID=A0A0A8Z5S4_ARUDO